MEYLFYSPFAIGIIAVVGGIAMAIAQRVMLHKERMAMIEQGIHPDLAEPRAEDPPKP